MEFCKKPSRSDIHQSFQEEAKIEYETREYFDGIAPKRHTKPQRSEYSTRYVDYAADLPVNGKPNLIPEYVEFQRLENLPQEKLMSNNGRSNVTEEFVETQYYKDLNCIDKEHHTTGTGFIKMENANGNCFCLEPDSATTCHASCKGNPATNDWIPATTDTVILASGKPKRSDN